MNKIKNIYFFLFLYFFNIFKFFCFCNKIKINNNDIKILNNKLNNNNNNNNNNNIKIFKKKELSNTLKEISGIQYIDGYFWVINDSTNESTIYQLDPINFNIRFTIKLPKYIKNIDWEDITFDKYNKNLYIADTGNNSGNRIIQVIYIINLNKINYKNPKKFSFLLDKDKIKKIKFIYEKKEPKLKIKKKFLKFNCEAILYYNNKIHIFTKEKKKQPIIFYHQNQDFIKQKKFNL